MQKKYTNTRHPSKSNIFLELYHIRAQAYNCKELAELDRSILKDARKKSARNGDYHAESEGISGR